MAELHVEAKKHSSSPAWIWVVVALLAIGALIYFLTRDNSKVDDSAPANSGTTSYITDQAAGAIYVYAA